MSVVMLSGRLGLGMLLGLLVVSALLWWLCPPLLLGKNVTGASSPPLVSAMVAKGKAPIKAKKGEGKGATKDESSSRPPMVEKKFNGSGSLLGYILKVDSEEKEERSYDLVNYSLGLTHLF
ncbi:putative N [Sesbania bispinosa]|nr:putative N [Sesbania bispinosa]